ncbi:hypothetical protein AB205_0009450 [Aquarana catesbeiana]|uniref:Uncharacterized protein n=1 Tax=Aquarana catesbeiana TaxID=8400 RepID=A0A2G9Q9F3_AQUCT|nr:hypothetical protein AB205_0009450 [Aquarana catesbeiana]
MTSVSPGCGHTRGCIFGQTRLDPGSSLSGLHSTLPSWLWLCCWRCGRRRSRTWRRRRTSVGEGPGYQAACSARPPPGRDFPVYEKGTWF